MSPRKIAIAVGVALVLVAVAVVTEVVVPRWQSRRGDAATLLLAPGEPLERLVVARPDGTFRVEPADSGGYQAVDEASQAAIPADVRAMVAVREALSGARLLTDIGRADGLDLKAYGLQPPRVTLSWSRPSGRAWTLSLGSPTVGGQVHALAEGRVVLVSGRLLEAADHGLDHFRAKRVIEAPEGAIDRIAIARRADQIPQGSTTELVLARRLLEGETDEDRAYEWILESPLGVPAEPVRVASLLSRLSALSALGFGEEQPDDAALRAKGLVEPTATLALRRVDGTTTVLRIGDPSPSGHAWARIDDGPLVEIRSDVARDALLGDDFWRDSRVVKLPKWRIVNVQARKGRDASAMDVEMAFVEPEGWRLVRPEDRPLDPIAADAVLEALGGMLCGRFEDDLAKSETDLRQRWDFDAPGSIDLSVLAILADGTPRRADVELTPFVRERRTYFAARSMDEMARVEACVTAEKQVDELLDELRRLAGPATTPAP